MAKQLIISLAEQEKLDIISNGLDLTNKLAIKADKTYVDSELLSKPNATDVYNKAEVDAGFSVKADKTELTAKTDKTYVDSELATKADASTVNAKADKTYVDSELANKADASTVTGKADKTYVDTELAKKPNTTDVTASLDLKADKTYVDTELGDKADTTHVDTELAKKATKTNTYTKAQVDTSLDLKVDKEAGKELSTNDYTDVDKAKIDDMIADLTADGMYMRKKDGATVNWEQVLDKFTLMGANTEMLMMLTDTDGSGQMQAVDQTTGHVVSSFEYHGGTNSVVFSLFDKNTGVRKNQMILQPNGEVLLTDSKMDLTQDDASKEIVTAEQLHGVMLFYAMEIFQKANKSDLMSIFYGDALPTVDFGKNGDRYHYFQNGASTELINVTATNDYNAKGFKLYETVNASDLLSIDVYPAYSEVYFTYAPGTMPKISDPVITINGHSEPLAIRFMGGTAFSAYYDATFESVIDAVTIGQTVKVESDVVSGRETDYYKYNDVWIERPIFPYLYEHKTITDHVVTTEASYADMEAGGGEILNNLSIPLDKGVYTISFADTFHSTDQQHSGFTSWSIDGGTSREVFSEESKDKTDRKHSYYAFAHTQAADGVLNILVKAALETDYNTNKEFKFYYQTITVERKK